MHEGPELCFKWAMFEPGRTHGQRHIQHIEYILIEEKNSMDYRFRSLFFLSISLIAASLFTGLVDCSRAFAQSSQSQSLAPKVTVNRIAVMPLTRGRSGTSLAETLDAPLFLFSPDPENVAEDADRLLTEYVYNKMVSIHGGKLAPLDKAMEFFLSAPRDATGDTIRSLAQKTGNSLNANVVVTGYIWRYKKRIGGPRAASSPASVSFALVLIETSNGRVLWRGRFEEKQAALSENILNAKTFFDRGGKWLTVDELARYGVNEIFKKYPYR